MKSSSFVPNILALLSLVLLVVIFTLSGYVSRKGSELQVATAEAQAAKAELQTLQDKKARIDNLSTAERAVLDTAIAPKLDQDMLIRQLSTLATNAGFSLGDISFNNTVPGTGSVNAVQANTSFTALSTASSAAALFDAIEKSDRLLRLSSFTLTTDERGIVTVNGTIDAFYTPAQ